jgi:DNA-binding NarL/FixJ family response regulator
MRRIFLINDQAVELECWQSVIERHADLCVCGVADAPIESSEAEAADLILVRSCFGFASLFDARARRFPKPSVVVVNDNDERTVLQTLRRAPAGVLTDRDTPESLLEALRCDAAHRPYCSPRVSRLLTTQLPAQLKNASDERQLSLRQFQIFCLLGTGKTTTEIAQMLRISLKTVQGYVARVKVKCGFRTMTELLREAVHQDRAVNG